MKLHTTLNLQAMARKIAARSRYDRYERENITERQVYRVLNHLFEVWEEALSTPGGKISIDPLGILEVAPKKVGGSLKKGDGAAEVVAHETHVIRFRPAKHIKAKLKENSKDLARNVGSRGER